MPSCQKAKFYSLGLRNGKKRNPNRSENGRLKKESKKRYRRDYEECHERVFNGTQREQEGYLVDPHKGKLRTRIDIEVSS